MDIKLLKFIRNDDSIDYKFEKDGLLSRDIIEKTSHEAPVQKLDEMIYGLRKIAAHVTGISEGWFGDDVVMTGVTFTKNFACKIHYEKTYLITETKRKEKTPAFYFRDVADDDLKTPERQVPADMSEHLEEVITLSIGYINGDRQQLLLPLQPEKPQTEPGDPVDDDSSGVDDEMTL